jgi:hypothetical protein
MLDCDPSYLWMIEKGRKVPGRRIANAIERATKDAPGGPIRSEQWDRTAAHRDSVRPARAARQ